MTRALSLVVLLGLSGVANAGSSTPPVQLSGYAMTSQLSSYATTTQLSSYATTTQLAGYATTTQMQAAQSALQNQIPTPCALVPSPDTLNGTVGVLPCALPSDSTRPTAVQAAIVTTSTAGIWTVTWAKAFMSASPYINPQPINSGAQPVLCNVTSSTSTSATGKCWQIVTMTLPTLASSLLGLVLNPTGVAASFQVRVAARDTTQ